MDVIRDPTFSWVIVHGGKARTDFKIYILKKAHKNSRGQQAETTKVMISVPTSSRSAYKVCPSFSGPTVASFHTASQASPKSKPEVIFFKTASAMRESAWVPIYIDSVINCSHSKETWTHHDIGLDYVLPHRQPTALRRYFIDTLFQRESMYLFVIFQHTRNHAWNFFWYK